MKDNIAQSEVVVLWGVNFSHFQELDELKSKQLIVIDPDETEFTKNADLHVAIKSKGDIFFAVMLSRFLFISDMIDVEFLEKYASDYEDYHDFTQEFRIVLTLKKIGLDISDIKDFLEIIVNKKVLIICGSGLGLYDELDDMREVLNAFGMLLGLFNKKGCGIFHLDSNSFTQCFDLKNDDFKFIDEIETDILKEM